MTEAYLVTFERILTAHGIDETRGGAFPRFSADG